MASFLAVIAAIYYDYWVATIYTLLRLLIESILHSVIEHRAQNRMTIQNLAIVFGPTLMRPEECEMPDLAVSMVQRGQLIEFLLQDYPQIFSW